MIFTGLRIALVGPLPPPAGGMANQTRQLAALLRADGAQVQLLAVNGPVLPPWLAPFLRQPPRCPVLSPTVTPLVELRLTPPLRATAHSAPSGATTMREIGASGSASTPAPVPM